MDRWTIYVCLILLISDYIYPIKIPGADNNAGKSFLLNTTSEDPLGISLDIANDDNNDDPLGISLENNDQPLGTSLICQDDMDTSANSPKLDVFDFCDDDGKYENTVKTPSKIRHNENKQLTSTPIAPFKNQMKSDLWNDSFSDYDDETSPIDSLKDLLPEDLGSVTPKVNITSFSTAPKRERTVSRILEKSLRHGSLLQIKYMKKCCISKCHLNVNMDMARRCREILWTKDFESRHEWLIQKLRDAKQNNGKYFLMIENGLGICSKAFCQLFYISKGFYYKSVKDYENGVLSTGYQRRRSKTSLYDDAKFWLEEYATYHADRMPDSEDVMLPYKTRKEGLYLRYKSERVEKFRNFFSKTSFMRMWADMFPHLKIKKTNCFTKCDKCVSLNRRLERTLNPERRRLIKKALNEHNNRQMMERQYYYNKREQSRNEPTQYLSIIFDGMDQGKTSLPHLIGSKAKSVGQGDLLKTHITGVISHGHRLFRTFIDTCEYPHDSNLSINVILLVLQTIAAKMGNKLPPTLYLQADNCWRENKNRFMLGFCELLIRNGVFKEIELSFLIVGHTHEDIDSYFHKIADSLRQQEAETMDDLLYLLKNGQRINVVYDFRNWIEPHLNDIKHHTKPLHFKFIKTSSGVKLLYKGLHTQPWVEAPSILKTLPKGEPVLQTPNFEKLNIDGIERNQRFLRPLYSDQRDASQYIWWQKYIKRIRAFLSSDALINQYLLKFKTQWMFAGLPKLSHEEQPTIESVIPSEVVRMLEIEQEQPTIVVGKKTAAKRKGGTQGTDKSAKRKKQSRGRVGQSKTSNSINKGEVQKTFSKRTPCSEENVQRKRKTTKLRKKIVNRCRSENFHFQPWGQFIPYDLTKDIWILFIINLDVYIDLIFDFIFLYQYMNLMYLLYLAILKAHIREHIDQSISLKSAQKHCNIPYHRDMMLTSGRNITVLEVTVG